MLVVIAALVIVICAAGWIKGYISNAVLLWYLIEKGFPLPSKDELEEGGQWVAKHILRDLTGRKHIW